MTRLLLGVLDKGLLRLGDNSTVNFEKSLVFLTSNLGAREMMREINPEVVYASLSGFGAEGPYRDRSAYDTVVQAYAGMAANQADPNDGTPVFLRQTAADKVTVALGGTAHASAASA